MPKIADAVLEMGSVGYKVTDVLFPIAKVPALLLK